MRRYAWWLLLICLATPPVHAQTTAPADGIPRDVLLRMDQRELGPRYDSAAADSYARIHALLERYFTASAAERRQIVARIEQTGIDASVVGRLARIRLNWPALQSGVYYINERAGPHDVHYFLGIPPTYDRSTPWPLVVKLPGASPLITDPKRSPDEVAGTYTDWMCQELAAHPDAIVLMPLLNLDELYGPSYAGMNSVMQPLLHAATRLNIDPARVYLTGHSMGAHAVWNLALHYPTYFAAINPLAGSAPLDWQRLRVMNLRNVLPVVWHDADDDVIPVDGSRSLVKVLRQLQIDVQYDETKGVGHAPPDRVANQLYQAMRTHQRDLYPARVCVQSNRPDTLFNRADWVQVYQPLYPGEERRLLFRHGSGHMVVSQNPVSIDAIRSPLPLSNRIDVKTANVASFRLYLNDQMVDFTQPLVVAVNGKPRFQGLLKPSIDELLKDQLFLGRGWRYYSAIIDIDLTDGPAPHPTTRPTTRRGTIEYLPDGATQPKRIEVPARR